MLRFSFDRVFRQYGSVLRQERTIIVLGSVIVVALTVYTALSIACSHDRAIARSEAELRTIVKVLAAQTQREFEAIELAQTGLAENLLAQAGASPAAFAAFARSKSFHDQLVQKKDALPAVNSLTAFSLDGALLSMSLTWPTPSIDSSDRAFVRAFKTNPRLRTFLSEPLKSRGSDAWSVFIADKVGAADEPGVGIVAATIRLSHFEDFYASIGLPADASVSLFRRDGVLLARFPHVEPAIGTPGTGAGVSAPRQHFFGVVLGQATSGLSRQVSSIDGQERLIAGQTLDRFPVVITVARSLEAVLANWKADALELAVATLVTDLIAATAGLLGLSQIRRANRLARFDAVTTMPNRVIFHEAMAAAHRRSNGRFALLILDLDQFKEVNDSLGHQAGDTLLRAAAKRIQSVLKPCHTLTRLGGDEFAIVLTRIAGHADAEAVATAIIAAFAAPFDIAGRKLVVGVSIGIAVAPDTEGDADMLYRDADLALYRAKSEQRGTYRFFAPAMAEQCSARKTLVHQLRAALEAGDLHLVFQPLFDLRMQAVCGFEALARWTHPDLGIIEPGRFIPIAEDSGLIGPLGRWVLRQACLEASRWPGAIRIAVNVSAVQFKVCDVFADVADALALSGLDPARLELEITESVQIVENEQTGDALLRIKALGVRIALDDFGTGCSSLSYLRSFPFDKVKVDLPFVATMLQSKASRAIVETVLALAQKLGMETTAEGVETVEQLTMLGALGCTEVQGFFIAEPVGPDTVLNTIARLHPPVAQVA